MNNITPGVVYERRRSSMERVHGEQQPRPVEDAWDIRLVHAPARTDEILQLRRIAYRADGKCGLSTAEPDVDDPRDMQAISVVVEADNQLVGSIRLCRPQPGSLLHHDCQLEGPVHSLPPRSLMFESGCAAVHPDHRGRGLSWLLMAHHIRTAWTEGGRYLVAGIDELLEPHWSRCGFRRTAVSYCGALSGNLYTVMVLDVAEVLAGHHTVSRFTRLLRDIAPLQG